MTLTGTGVHHEPVEAAVPYRVTTPDGVEVISGDTRVCDEVVELARDFDVLVHEVCRKAAMSAAIAGSAFEKIFDYHADKVQLGEFAHQFGIRQMVLTHLIPQPRNEHDIQEFEWDHDQSEYSGRVTVGNDLDRVEIRKYVNRCIKPGSSVIRWHLDFPRFDPNRRTSHWNREIRSEPSRLGFGAW